MSRILVVGAGLSGATIAQNFAQAGSQVVVLDKKTHIAGNCYDHLDGQTGIRVSDYGAHIFHTNSQSVWNYVTQFSSWKPYEHRVLVKVKNALVQLPINLNSVNQFFGLNLQTPLEMRQFLDQKITKLKVIRNSEDYVLSTLGSELYEAIFKNYSFKQWELDPSELDSSVIKRNPVRFNQDDRYFTDQHQALPEGGFEHLVAAMLKNPLIEVRLETDFFDFRKRNNLEQFDMVFYTGPIDQYFDYAFGRLQYRSLNFQFEQHDLNFYQESAVVNYPDLKYPFTRITEYKYFYQPQQPSKKTIISKEFPTWEGEPYYPVLNKKNQTILKKYLQEVKKLEKKGIYFLGRLGTYRYINMDQAIAEALILYKKICGAHKT